MHWQDIVFTLGTVVFIIALIPSIRSEEKPALSTSFPTATVLAVFTYVYFSLSLWITAAFTAIICFLWFVLAFQKYKSKSKTSR